MRGGKHECRRRIGDFQTLTSELCDCSGYVPIEGALADATFAQPSTEAEEQPLPQLRVVPR